MLKIPNILVLGGILIFGIIVLSLVLKNYAVWRQNRDLPLSGDEAVVVSKRAKDRYTVDTDRKLPNSDHFVTFHLPSRDQTLEMRVSAADFSAISEGDQGMLWHHGIFFKRFDQK